MALTDPMATVAALSNVRRLIIEASLLISAPATLISLMINRKGTVGTADLTTDFYVSISMRFYPEVLLPVCGLTFCEAAIPSTASEKTTAGESCFF